MAYSESELPEGIQDILAYMPRDMRQRALADYETHYQPFLAMLAGWKSAVQSHYAYGEEAAIARLQEQFFPLGDWKFPAQGLAIPQRPPERATDISADAQFTDSSNRPWISCGDGWVQPTALHQAALQMVNEDWIVTIDVDYLGAGQPEAILERGQLAFVAGAEEFIVALGAAQWWVQTPNQRLRPARFSRYDGYMSFEREMQTARMNQKHLELWLPPCYPYSRKIVRLSMAPNAQSDPNAPDVSWAGSVTTGFRFVGLIRNPGQRATSALRAQANLRRGGQLVYLNPVPIAQAAVQTNYFHAPFASHGSEYALRATGAPDIFAGVVYVDDGPIPASLYRIPGNDPKAKHLDAVLQFPQKDARRANVKLYFGSTGQETGDARDDPGFAGIDAIALYVPVPHYRRRDRWFAGNASGKRQSRMVSQRFASAAAHGGRHHGDYPATEKFVWRSAALSLRDSRNHSRSGRGQYALEFVSVAFHRPERDQFDARYDEIPAANYVPLMQNLRAGVRARPRCRDAARFSAVGCGELSGLRFIAILRDGVFPSAGARRLTLRGFHEIV